MPNNNIDKESLIYDYLALKSVKGMTDALIHNLYIDRNTISGASGLTFEELQSYGLSPTIAKRIITSEYDKKFIDHELELSAKHKVEIVTLEDENYPKLLKEISSPPPYLYCKGDVSLLNATTVGIVGARKCSRISEEFTRKLSADLASIGFTVVSGFALGIDIVAHLGAVSRGSTIAVLGSGYLNMYPKQHIKHIDQVLENGLFVTEFSLEEPPLATNFPRRNRIISGLSLGIVVIEASPRSGSLITCRFAVEQNREVFAVPNFPSAFNSATNKLIKEGAKLIENYLDILEEFKYLFVDDSCVKKSDVIKNNEIPVFNNALKHSIYKVIILGAHDIDSLCLRLNMQVIDVLSVLTELEIEGYIYKDKDHKYYSCV